MSPTELTTCTPLDGGCGSYRSGHHMHFIHAKHIGASPWGWRDGVIESIEDDGWTVIRYLAEDALVRVWHHRRLSGLVTVGAPIRLHERYYALGGPFGWLNVAVRDGLGAVPEPADPQLWAQETTGGVVDLASGRGLALDHLRLHALPLEEDEQ